MQLLHYCAPTYGQISTDAPQQSKAANEKRAPVTTRTDLGPGLELLETVEFSGDQLAATHKSFRRDGQVVMTHTIAPSVNTNFRVYYRNGKAILTEQMDQKGRIVTLYVTDGNSAPIDVYQRQEDGTTMPISSEQLAKAKRLFGHVKKHFGPVAEAASKENESEAMDQLERAKKELENSDDTLVEEGDCTSN